MSTIPFITTDAALVETVTPLVASSELPIELDVFADPAKALEHLSIEMPELVFVNFSDPALDAFAVLDDMKKDPWLLHGGIIGLCDEYDDAQKVERLQGANIIVALTREDLPRHLPKVLTIIHNNRRILFQREIGADIVANISGSFKLENDLVEASCYTNLICNFLFNTNRLNVEKKSQLNLALTEMLINAIEHGNCGINFEEKSAWLEQGRLMGELIMSKCEQPPIAARRVTFEYDLGPTASRFLIADEGAGFDWRHVKDVSKMENLFELHGRGILVTKQFTRSLTYNEAGNQVRFEISYDEDAGIMRPGLFENLDPIDVKEGDTVFDQGESSDFLYYIAKGRYDVIVNGAKVSSLTPEDLFMGEMAFLLNNRRSAMVRAASDGRLIKISKKQFVNAIKKKPHYALFLCRLLAQRVVRANMASAAKK